MEKQSPKQSLTRFLIQFPNNTFIDAIPPFNYQTTLVGEGSWDTKNSSLCIAACRLLNPTGYYNLANTRVGDCSFRLGFAFPATWTTRYTSTIVGSIWTTKDFTSPSYFPRITLRSIDFDNFLPGLRYKHTEMNGKVQNLCPYQKQLVGKNKHHYWKYPNV